MAPFPAYHAERQPPATLRKARGGTRPVPLPNDEESASAFSEDGLHVRGLPTGSRCAWLQAAVVAIAVTLIVVPTWWWANNRTWKLGREHGSFADASTSFWAYGAVGCRNWQMIEHARSQVGSKSDCEELCGSDPQCESYNWQELPCEHGWPVANGCILFHGGCVTERNECWELNYKITTLTTTTEIERELTLQFSFDGGFGIALTNPDSLPRVLAALDVLHAGSVGSDAAMDRRLTNSPTSMGTHGRVSTRMGTHGEAVQLTYVGSPDMCRDVYEKSRRLLNDTRMKSTMEHLCTIAGISNGTVTLEEEHVEPTTLEPGVEIATGHKNCAGYKNYADLPTGWCARLVRWAACGIGDGLVLGQGYRCEFQSMYTGGCKYGEGNLCESLMLDPTPAPTEAPTPVPTQAPA